MPPSGMKGSKRRVRVPYVNRNKSRVGLKCHPSCCTTTSGSTFPEHHEIYPWTLCEARDLILQILWGRINHAIIDK